MLAQHPLPEDHTMDAATMRRNVSELHEKGNAKFMATFKGTLEEKTVKTDAAGKKFIFHQ